MDAAPEPPGTDSRRVLRWWAGKGPAAKRTYSQRVPQRWACKGPAAKPLSNRLAARPESSARQSTDAR
ncbi:hypothetical protein DZD52_05235 [Xanthomonas nasturtii]|uniref:Uncharacterized protein n=1 Tax=Xanthomonas nasturtii TaxID=1843581 RepID=A0A3E1KQ74_9XANT|nr:hypothetical protein DZD52_05235 [Xanthomonas nasturtii]